MPKRKTWQELSAEINQFAEQNIRNAGWDLRTSKQKSRSEADLFYLTSQTTQVIRRAEKVLQDSLESQQKLQAWDKKMGLKRCHSRTMTKSSITRKQLLQHLRELKMQMRADHQGSNNSPIDFENAVANLPL
jgi:carbonic anhydrase